MVSDCSGIKTFVSTEQLSEWDMPGVWNKVALLSLLAEPTSRDAAGTDWILWLDEGHLT